MAQAFTKDPDSVLDYAVDWSAWLNGDTITTSVWSVTSGITVDSESETDSVATVWLSGGTAGVTYTATNRITTAGGRTDDRSLTIVVRGK